MNKLIFFFFAFFFFSSRAGISDCAISTTTATIETCVKCNQGFFIVKNGLACAAEIPNCFEYSEDDKALCKTCMQNYILTSNKKACLPPIDGCMTQTDGASADTQVCAVCKSGLVPSSTGKYCVKPITNCNRFNANGTCIEIKGCKTYDATNPNQMLCNACFDDLAPTNSKLNCVPKIKDCATYEDDGTCRACIAAGTPSLSNTRKSCFAKDATCDEMNDFGLCTRCVNPKNVPMVRRQLDCIAFPCPNTCVIPRPNCTIYDSVGACLRCNPGQVLFSDYCFNPIPQCNNYLNSGSDYGKCAGCISGFDLDKAIVNNQGVSCWPSVTDCTSYDPKTGNCMTCTNPKIRVITGPTSSVCLAVVQYCAVYGAQSCIKCIPLYELSGASCVLSVPNCAKYDAGGKCSDCVPNFALVTDAAADPKCVPAVASCATYTYATEMCATCSGGLVPTGSGKVCVTAITDCIQYDDVKKNCIACNAKVPSFSGVLCGAPIANCLFLDDKNAIKCAQCSDRYILAADLKSCVSDPAGLSTVSTVAQGTGAIQIITNSGGKTYCLAHALGDVIKAGVVTEVSSSEFTSKKADVSFKNCDEVDYRNTLWQAIPESGVYSAARTDLDIGSTGKTLAFAVYYNSGSANNNALKIVDGSYTHTKSQVFLNGIVSAAAVGGYTLELSLTSFLTFNVAWITKTGVTGPLAGEDAFNPQLTLQMKKLRTLGAATAADTFGAVADGATPATLGYLGFNSLTPTALAKTYIFSAAAPTGAWINLRNIFLDATTDSSKPFGLLSQVDMSYAQNDDQVTFRWQIKNDITDLANIFPAVLGQNTYNASDRTALSNHSCNFRYGINLPNSGWRKGLSDNKFTQIVFNLPLFDLVSRCGFSYTTSTTGADKGNTYMVGRYGFFTAASLSTNNNGDGLFKDLKLTLGVMTNERKLYIDNPISYQWFKAGSDDISVKFNAQLRFFVGNQELLGVRDASDLRGLIVPSGSTSGSGLQGRLSLVSYLYDTDFSPPSNYADGLDRNVKSYKPLNENFTITSVNLKLIKTVITDASANPKTVANYVTYVPAINLKMSTTDRNTATFDVDLRGVLSGQYNTIVEYQITSARVPALKRLLTETGSSQNSQVFEKLEVPNEEKADKDSFMTLSGTATSFKLDYQYKMKLTAFIGIIMIFFFA